MNPYRTLAIMLAINAVVMFVLTYALIAEPAHLLPNINRIYMAVIMVLAMLIPMMLLMWKMYPDKKRNFAILGVAVIGVIVIFGLMRTQTPVGNAQFLRSMIPHHSSAIVMCEEASISDPEILTLCEEIVAAQRREIAEMQTMLERY